VGASPLGPIWKEVETGSLPRGRGHCRSSHRGHDVHCRDAVVLCKGFASFSRRVRARWERLLKPCGLVRRNHLLAPLPPCLRKTLEQPIFEGSAIWIELARRPEDN